MALSSNQFQQFQSALLAAFNSSSLTQMLRFEMGESLNNIVGGGSFRDTVFGLIEWAEQQGRTGELVEAAHRANPGNPLLKAFRQEFTVSSSSADSGSPVTSTPVAAPVIPQPDNAANAAPSASVRRTKVFISYSHKDKEWLDRLQVHLKPLEREGIVERWDDTRIQTGQRWADEIKKALAEAKVAVLLISADFLASDFIANDELPPILAAEANEQDRLIVMPLILSPSRFQRLASLSQFQAANDASKPLINLAKGEQEAAFVKLVEDIERELQ